MELLQLIFCVIIGLSAGAMGAVMVMHRGQQSNRDLFTRLHSLELQSAADRQTIRRLSEVSSAAAHDLNQRLQAALAVRDEYIKTLNQRLIGTEHAQLKTDRKIPQRRLQERINDTAGRIASVHSDVGRLEQRVQTKLIALREAMQSVLQQLAESQIDEAERLSKLSTIVKSIDQRIDGLEQSLATLSHQAVTPPPSADLELLFGLGPKMAKQLRTNGIDNLFALAALTDEDLERLNGKIRGIKERAVRHEWIKQAKDRLKLKEEPPPPSKDESSREISERGDAIRRRDAAAVAVGYCPGSKTLMPKVPRPTPTM
ncbi:MAG: hypothetical protein AAF449_11790 [Myxococcota bacterium]